jgi:DNA end-binding protein Ku
MASTVWRGYLTFGLISIPVRLFRAARAERISFRQMYRAAPDERSSLPERGVEGARSSPGATPATAPDEPSEPQAARGIPQPAPVLTPIERPAFRREIGQLAPAQSLVKGFEYQKNRYIAIEAEELKAAAAKTSTQMEIEECVHLSEIDPVYFETSYYMSPEQAGEKAYALLFEALRTTGLVAMARFAMHNREHVVVIRPGKRGLLAHTMFYASEVRAGEEYRADIASISQKELNLAQTLVASLAAPFEPSKYKDPYRERLASIIAAKVNQTSKEPVLVSESRVTSSGVIDFAEVLRMSLANLKKPAQAAKSRSAVSPAKLIRKRAKP